MFLKYGNKGFLVIINILCLIFISDLTYAQINQDVPAKLACPSGWSDYTQELREKLRQFTSAMFKNLDNPPSASEMEKYGSTLFAFYKYKMGDGKLVSFRGLTLKYNPCITLSIEHPGESWKSQFCATPLQCANTFIRDLGQVDITEQPEEITVNGINGVHFVYVLSGIKHAVYIFIKDNNIFRLNLEDEISAFDSNKTEFLSAVNSLIILSNK